MEANNFHDESHLNAIRYAIKQALYNKALHSWQQSPTEAPPKPENFTLSPTKLKRKETKALRELEQYVHTQTIK